MFGNVLECTCIIIRLAIIISTILFLDPRVPAFEGAPLYQHRSKQVADTGDKASDPSDVKTEDKEGETVENGTSKEEQRQSDQSAEEEQWTTTTMTPPTVTPEIFPVVVFSHGLAAMRTMYCGICSDLASHGLIVAAVEHRCVKLRLNLPIKHLVYSNLYLY